MDGDDNALTSQEARSCVFSPVDLLFRRRVRGFLTGTTTPSLRRSSFVRFLPAHVREKTDYYFDEETTFSLRVARSNVFSSCYSFVFKERFLEAETII